MKYNLKRIILVTVCLLGSLTGWALNYQSFIVNGVGYKILTANTVAVTNRAQGPQHSVQVIPAYQDISYSDYLYIPPTVVYDGITYTVTHILENTFQNCTSLTGITISNSVQEIGSNAFHEAGLKTLVINDGSTPLSIVNNGSNLSPFYGCPIETLHLGRDINHISSNNIYAYTPFGTSLKNVETSNQVTSIRPYTFYNCTNLKTVFFSSNIEEIGRYAFYNCKSLQAANLGDKVSSIGTYAFYGCDAMQTVHISDNVKIIQPYTFYGCTSLKTRFTWAATSGTSAVSIIPTTCSTPR